MLNQIVIYAAPKADCGERYAPKGSGNPALTAFIANYR